MGENAVCARDATIKERQGGKQWKMHSKVARPCVRACVHVREMYRDVHTGINWQKRFIETADAFGGFVYFATNAIKGRRIARSDICRMSHVFFCFIKEFFNVKISRSFADSEAPDLAH